MFRTNSPPGLGVPLVGVSGLHVQSYLAHVRESPKRGSLRNGSQKTRTIYPHALRPSYKSMRLGGKLIDERPAHSQSVQAGRFPRLIAETPPFRNFTSSSQTSPAERMVGFRDLLRANDLYPYHLNRAAISKISCSCSKSHRARHFWRVKISVTP